MGGMGDQGRRIYRLPKTVFAELGNSWLVFRAQGLRARIPRVTASAIGIWQPMKPNVFKLNDASDTFQGLSTTRARERGNPKWRQMRHEGEKSVSPCLAAPSGRAIVASERQTARCS